MRALEARNITLGYSRRKAPQRILVEGLNVSLAPGEILAVIGANGAGKSTLLRALAGIQKSLDGKIFWQGKPLQQIPESDRPTHLSALFRGFARPDGFTVEELVMLGRHPYTGFWGKPRDADHLAVAKALETTGMTHFAASHINTLSDGELQKAMLAKLLAQDAPIMVLDEPTTHLDLPSAFELLMTLRHLAADEGKAIVLSTHNLDLVFKMVHRVLLLSGNGEWAEGTPAEVAQHHLMCGFLKTKHIRFEGGNLHYQIQTK